MAPPKSPEDRTKLSKLFKMLKPHSADIEDFPDNERDFAALSAAELSSLSDEALLEMKNGPNF